ncbi:MAG: integrase arm-type DNA-binding domain-containing protein [Pseudomonadota bacterium]
MPLTDRQIKAAKPKEKPYKLGDSGGLFLLVNANGSKLWRLKYRHLGKEKTLSFGRYPDLTLQKARLARDAARAQIAENLDPGDVKKAEQAEAREKTEQTFAALTADYLQKLEKEGRAPSTLKKNTWLLDMAIADFGTSPVKEIKAPLILKTLRKIEDRGTLETANRLRSLIGKVMRYGMACGWIDADPTPALRGALIRPPKKNRAAITDPQEFGGLLRALDDFGGQKATQIGLRLLALPYPRPGELRLATWAEFDFDTKIWSIPAERMKMRRAHRVPLPDIALEELQQLHRTSGHHDLILPSYRSWKTPMSNNTFNAALRRMGYTKDEMTAHGFRATFSTIANESGKWNPDAIERALAHVEGNDIRRAYDRSEHWDERVRMADWWAKTCHSLKVQR